jgi:hypothetical protein
MKKTYTIVAFAVLALAGVFAFRLFGAEARTPGAYEYVTIRWAGKDNTHVIRPGVRLSSSEWNCASCQNQTGPTIVPFT